jgi:MraZ protein
MIFRQFVSDVEIVSLDSNGRFLLPKRYIKLAHINQEVKVIGVDNTIEIWATELCEQPFMNPEEFSLELQKMMDNNKKAEE